MDLNLGYRFLLAGLIIVINAFFSGAEVALLSVRQSRLKHMAEEGNAGAQAAMSLLANPERFLSVVQVGVTLASLALGWAGQDTMYEFLTRLVHPLETDQTRPFLQAISFALAFLLITFLHVVVGEVVPKNLAIDRSDKLATLVAPGLLVFYRVAAPFARVIERAAAWVSRRLGIRGDSAGATHTPEEIRFIVSASHKHGHIDSFTESATQRLLDLADLSAREIMTPRRAFASAPVESTLEQLLRIFSENKYSRIPVYERSTDNVLGIVYAKDLLEVWQQRLNASSARRPVPAFDLRRLLRQPPVVPETKLLNQLVDTFRFSRSHMALVVDEFGSVTGLVTLEDVLEQVFGEIEDEHDVKLPPLPVAWESIELDGVTPIRDLELHYQIELPTNAGFETLAGFLLYRLGEIPQAGQYVDEAALRFTVESMEGNRIDKVRVERQSPELAG